MSKTLAELRADKPTGRPQRTLTLCLAPHLVAEVQALTDEHDRLTLTPSSSDAEGAPQRAGGDPQVKKIRARLSDLLQEMTQYEGELTIRANLTDGEWRRWSNEHPARGEDEPGADRDMRVAGGYCNADALIDSLATFCHEWNGDPLTGTDWSEVFEPVIASADKADVASRIVEMYESRLDFRRLRSNLSTSLKRLNGSSSPATSESPTSDSTAGSLDKSIAATTETATA